MIFENNGFGVGGGGGGDVNFFTEANFILMNTKNHHSEPENYLLDICIQIKMTYENLFET